MSILVVGSVGFDDVETPAGVRTGVLGGACTYFGAAARLYTDVSLVGVVGTDFGQAHMSRLEALGIDLQGLQVAKGTTFAWSGRYGEDLDVCETLETRLNVFANFHPVIPERLRQTPFVFLANIDPELQIEVLEQMEQPRLVALDSMNYWITSKRDALTEAIKRADVVLLNESEVRLYTGQNDALRGADDILAMGPRALILKRGAHGAALVTYSTDLGERLFMFPAYPLPHVVDPTGAGDTFAAGFVGHLASTGDLSLGGLRRAVVHGTVVASYTIEDFSIDRLCNLTNRDIVLRYGMLRRLTYFQASHDSEFPCFARNVF